MINSRVSVSSQKKSTLASTTLEQFLLTLWSVMDTCQNGWELQCINVNGISLGCLEMPQKWNWLHILAVAFTVM